MSDARAPGRLVGVDGGRRPRPKRARRKLRVVSSRVLHTFERADGTEGHLYMVIAENEAGETVREKLRSFDELPADRQLREFEVEPYTGRHGVSYTLYRPRPTTREVADRVDQVARRVSHLTRRLEVLERHTAGPPATRREDVA